MLYLISTCHIWKYDLYVSYHIIYLIITYHIWKYDLYVSYLEVITMHIQIPFLKNFAS